MSYKTLKRLSARAAKGVDKGLDKGQFQTPKAVTMIRNYRFCYLLPKSKVYLIRKMKSDESISSNHSSHLNHTGIIHQEHFTLPMLQLTADKRDNVLLGFSSKNDAVSLIDSKDAFAEEAQVDEMSLEDAKDLACMLRMPLNVVTKGQCTSSSLSTSISDTDNGLSSSETTETGDNDINMEVYYYRPHEAINLSG